MRVEILFLSGSKLVFNLFRICYIWYMQKVLCILLIVVSPFILKSQSISRSVIAAQGDFSFNSTGSLSWTIGEVITETESNFPHIITQGFQQPDSMMYTSIVELFDDLEVTIFPNPTGDFLNIRTNLDYSFDVKCYNLLGLVVLENLDCKVMTKLDLSGLMEGSYFIELINSNRCISKKIKIIKIE